MFLDRNNPNEAPDESFSKLAAFVAGVTEGHWKVAWHMAPVAQCASLKLKLLEF